MIPQQCYIASKTAGWNSCVPQVRKLEVIKAKRATKRELIVVATMISRMAGTPVFSDRTEFSVTTDYTQFMMLRELHYWVRIAHALVS